MARWELLAPVLSVMLGSCAGGSVMPQQSSPAPTKQLISSADARRFVLAERSRLWKDPESIREARAGEPQFCTHNVLLPSGLFSEVQASCMCIELNAKNSYGGYTGIRRTIAVYLESGGFDTKDGGILGFQEMCAALTSFPEMNGGYVAPKPTGPTKQRKG